MAKKNNAARVDPERHSRSCTICGDPRREEIEIEFVEWKPIGVIARERKVSQAALYRHVNAMGLFGKRDRNLKAVLSRFIDRGYKAKVTGPSFISAIQAYAKINARGEWVDKTEDVNATAAQELFGRMNRGEMLKYAQTGDLPAWWPTEKMQQVKKDSNG